MCCPAATMTTCLLSSRRLWEPLLTVVLVSIKCDWYASSSQPLHITALRLGLQPQQHSEKRQTVDQEAAAHVHRCRRMHGAFTEFDARKRMQLHLFSGTLLQACASHGSALCMCMQAGASKQADIYITSISSSQLLVHCCTTCSVPIHTWSLSEMMRTRTPRFCAASSASAISSHVIVNTHTSIELRALPRNCSNLRASQQESAAQAMVDMLLATQIDVILQRAAEHRICTLKHSQKRLSRQPNYGQVQYIVPLLADSARQLPPGEVCWLVCIGAVVAPAVAGVVAWHCWVWEEQHLAQLAAAASSLCSKQNAAWYVFVAKG